MTREDLNSLDCLDKIVEVVNTKTTVIGLLAGKIKKFVEAEELDLILSECAKCRGAVQSLVNSERDLESESL